LSSQAYSRFDPKVTRKRALLATWLYVLLWPFLLVMGLAIIYVFCLNNLSILFGLPMVCFYLAIPISIPFVLYFIWSRYRRGQYGQTIFFCLLPVFFYLAATIFERLALAPVN
jgi:hypothetical protein